MLKMGKFSIQQQWQSNFLEAFFQKRAIWWQQDTDLKPKLCEILNFQNTIDYVVMEIYWANSSHFWHELDQFSLPNSKFRIFRQSNPLHINLRDNKSRDLICLPCFFSRFPAWIDGVFRGKLQFPVFCHPLRLLVRNQRGVTHQHPSTSRPVRRSMQSPWHLLWNAKNRLIFQA